jgi:hypothetical protein
MTTQSDKFKHWSRENLERLAAELTNEVIKLRSKVEEQQAVIASHRIQSHSPAFERVGREFPEDDGC